MTPTPDPALAARLAEFAKSDCRDNEFAKWCQTAWFAYSTGQLITVYDHTAAVQAAVAKAVEAEREANINAIKDSELLDGTNEPEDIAYMQGLYEAIAAIRARKGDAL